MSAGWLPSSENLPLLPRELLSQQYNLLLAETFGVCDGEEPEGFARDYCCIKILPTLQMTHTTCFEHSDRQNTVTNALYMLHGSEVSVVLISPNRTGDASAVLQLTGMRSRALPSHGSTQLSPAAPSSSSCVPKQQEILTVVSCLSELPPVFLCEITSRKNKYFTAR